MSDLSQFLGGKVLRWVSGNTYALDADTWSPISGHIYRRIVAGAGTTDPSADQTNWMLIGPRGIKSIQRGTTSGFINTRTLDITISAVDTSSCSVRLLGHGVKGSTKSFTDPGAGNMVTLDLTSGTNLRAEIAETSSSAYYVSWEIVEYWK